MDALDHEHVVVGHAQPPAVAFAHARLEIVLGQLHLLATEEGVELRVEQGQVEGVEALVVELAVGVERRVGAVHEVVVERNLQRFEAVGQQLDAEPLARRGLARRRRAGQQHQPHVLVAGYLVGNLRYFLLLQGLRHVDEVGGPPGIHHLVEVSHGADAHDALPPMVLLEDLEHLFLMDELGQHARRLQVGDAQQQAVVERLQPEEIELRGVGEQGSVVIIHVVVYPIISGVDGADAAQQLHFGLVALVLEHAYGLLGGYLVAGDGHAGVDNLLHAPPDAVHVGLFHAAAYLQIHVVSVAHRDVDVDPALGVEVVHGLAEHEEERARIVARARPGGHVEKLHVLVVVEPIVHSLHLIIDFGADGAVVHFEI